MDLDAISLQHLKTALNAWQQPQEIPEIWFTLDCLPAATSNSVNEKRILFQDWLHQLVRTQLSALRQAENLPDSAVATAVAPFPSETITRDFSVNNVQLEAWSALFYRYFYPHSLSFEQLAAAVPTDPRHLRRRINLGLDHLLDLIQRTELTAHAGNRQARLSQFLPPPDYVTLYGVTSLVKEVAQQLQSSSAPPFLSVEGMGGIGKTALARAVAYELAQSNAFSGIAWISARHEWLSVQGEILPADDPAHSLADIVNRLADQVGQNHLAGLSVEDKLAGLRPFFQRTPYLIVIDNLETAADTDLLLPRLTPLAGASRFLLTSRHSLVHFPVVQRVAVPPLSLADSRALVRSELARHGRPTELSPAPMRALHDIIGGVPLALKLTAAQLVHLPFHDVLAGLQKATRQTSEQLFAYIYRRSWQLLDKPAKALLLSLLSISPDGEDVDWLRLMSGLPEAEFEPALRQLRACSLLEMAGSPELPVYRLHRLTTTFLQTEILLNWS